MRLVLLDMVKQTAVTVAALPLADTTSTFGMVALDDGTFILVKQPAGIPIWMARRFTINQQHAMSCLGFVLGVGTVVGSPIHTTNGVFLPIANNGAQDFAMVAPGTVNNGLADDSLGCPAQ
jgi:hypothetical protein